jgi:hypothetical protein
MKKTNSIQKTGDLGAKLYLTKAHNTVIPLYQSFRLGGMKPQLDQDAQSCFLRNVSDDKIG